MKNNNYDPNEKVKEVNALGANYFATLIYKVERLKVVEVAAVTKSIVNQFLSGKTMSPKQAAVLMIFKSIFDPNRKP